MAHEGEVFFCLETHPVMFPEGEFQAGKMLLY